MLRQSETNCLYSLDNVQYKKPRFDHKGQGLSLWVHLCINYIHKCVHCLLAIWSINIYPCKCIFFISKCGFHVKNRNARMFFLIFINIFLLLTRIRYACSILTRMAFPFVDGILGAPHTVYVLLLAFVFNYFLCWHIIYKMFMTLVDHVNLFESLT